MALAFGAAQVLRQVDDQETLAEVACKTQQETTAADACTPGRWRRGCSVGDEITERAPRLGLPRVAIAWAHLVQLLS